MTTGGLEDSSFVLSLILFSYRISVSCPRFHGQLVKRQLDNRWVGTSGEYGLEFAHKRLLEVVMKSVWLDRHLVQNSGNLFPDVCVVCQRECFDRVFIRAATTNPIVGGLGYLLQVTKPFLVPAHLDKECYRQVKRRLIKRELLPMILMASGSIFSLLAAIFIHKLMIFSIFAVLILTAIVDYMLEQKKDWWIRIHESPADGVSGAYEFEFLDDRYANVFRDRNRKLLTQSELSKT